MTSRRYDVVTVGIQCIDIVSSPVPAGVLERELTLVSSTQLMLGGDALNQAVVLSRLGARAGLMGVVGNDRLGDVLVEQLAQYPLDVLARRADVNTAISQVLIEPSGERHFIYQPQSNLALGLGLEHIDPEAVKSAEFLSVGGCLSLPGLDGEDMLRLLDMARDAGTKTALDFRLSDAMPDEAMLKSLLSRADYVLPSEREAGALTGEADDPVEMVRRLRALGAGNVVVKLGGRGCYVDADGFTGMVAPFPCHCVDTTGAGDTFVGAFLYARTRGWDIHTCARFANAAGSIAVEHTGANAAIHSADQVLERMRG